ncbi:hypothetical protein [Dialister sp.]|jgi:hypothetical protein|uniref:hypothetical protein n=1 Tax=Dialister sp. TaxID=1955814 RepID=UPI003A5BE598
MDNLFNSMYESLLKFAYSSAKPTAMLIDKKYDQLLPLLRSQYKGETIDKEKVLRKILESVNTDAKN